MDQYKETLRERFSSFTYRELQKEAKANSISARQKKVELIEALVEQLSLNYNSGENSAASSPDPHNLNDSTIAGEPSERGGASGENSAASSPDPHNLNDSTIAGEPSERGGASGENSAVSLADPHNLNDSTIAGEPSERGGASGENSAVSLADPHNLNDSTVAGEPVEREEAAQNSENINTVCRSGNRFAETHSREFGKMPSILESRERLLQRHAQLTADIPAVFQRLASPKKAPRPYQEFKQVTEMKVRFQFGEGLPCGVVKMSDTSSPQASSSSAKRVHTPRIDVKNMTMAKTPNVTPSSTKTTPVWNGRINRVATPKGQRGTFSSDSSDEPHSPVHTPKSNRSYTPYKGSFRYVDTTKMSDRDFVIYQQKMISAKKEASNKAPNGEDGGGAGGSSNDDYSFDL